MTPARHRPRGNAGRRKKSVFIPGVSLYPNRMASPSAQNLSLNELFQLVHFYAEAGVDWVLEDEPQDRFAEFAALEAARARPTTTAAA
eukprot:gene1000-1359_t